MRYAVCRISDGAVINIIVADPSDAPPGECALIEIPDKVVCGIGWTWTGRFFDPPEWWRDASNQDSDLAIEPPNVAY